MAHRPMQDTAIPRRRRARRHADPYQHRGPSLAGLVAILTAAAVAVVVSVALPFGVGRW